MALDFLFVGIQFTITTKDRITQKQNYTRFDAIEYGRLSIFNVWITIPVITQVLLHNLQWPEIFLASKLYI